MFPHGPHRIPWAKWVQFKRNFGEKKTKRHTQGGFRTSVAKIGLKLSSWSYDKCGQHVTSHVAEKCNPTWKQNASKTKKINSQRLCEPKKEDNNHQKTMLNNNKFVIFHEASFPNATQLGSNMPMFRPAETAKRVQYIYIYIYMYTYIFL